MIPSTVYLVRPGMVEELRYSLRSLVNVTHDDVWIIGAAPPWVNRNPDTGIQVIERARGTSKYATTTGHLRALCTPGASSAAISDPFILWMDDLYAVRPVGDIPPLHLGPLDERLARFANLRSTWATGMRATAELLAETLPDRAAAGELVSYEAHAPLIVHKASMLAALDIAEDMTRRARITAPHKRTLYGNLHGENGLGGFQLARDPKWVSLTSDPPTGAWLSSDDASFKTLTGPLLRWLFPRPSPFETNTRTAPAPVPAPSPAPVRRTPRPGRRAVPSNVAAAERAR